MNCRTSLSLHLSANGARLAMLLGTASLLTMVNAIADRGRAYAADADAMTASDQMTENVVVTGSLLGDAEFEAPTPVTGISSAQVETRALTGIGTVIEELPFAAPGGGLDRNTTGVISSAQSMPNLRYLGANDTLVLIDGMRPTPVNSTNNFDTDMIPSSLVERFDVVTTGASASYGSDAVAGVVNFILKNHFEGFEANVQYGISEYGDTNEDLDSVTYGTSFADGKGHFIFGAEFANQYNTVTMYARPWGRNEPGLVALPTNRPAGLPANVFSNNVEVDNSTEGGLIVGCAPSTAKCPFSAPVSGGTTVAFDLSGNPYNFNYGSLAGTSYQIGNSNYGASSANRQLSPPYERSAELGRVEYDITPDIQAYATVNFGQLESDAPAPGTPFPIELKILSGNPFIPASIQSIMTANNISSINVYKENLDGLGTGNAADNRNSLLQSFFGLVGTVFGNYQWDVQGSAGRALVSQTVSEVPLNADLNQAAYVVKGSNGAPVCGPAATNPGSFINSNVTLTTAQIAAQAFPGCMPYNPFGTPSAASLNYILNAPDGNDGARMNVRQYMISGDLKGQPYQLPAGPLDVAIGMNWRYNSFSQAAYPPSEAMLYQTRDDQSFFASESVWESYGEIGIPIVKDLPFANSIDLNAAGRFTDYSISGSVFTWKYGATWDITDWLRLRSTLSQDIRAPNFSELSSLPTTGAGNLQNPLSGVSERFDTVSFGNPNLRPEVSRNFTAGVVFQPTWDFLSGFKASIDYYDIRVSGEIASESAQNVVNYCLLNKIQSYCNQITFDNGQVGAPGSDINTAFGIDQVYLYEANLNSETMSGWNLNFSEHFKLEDWLGIPGDFNISALGSYIQQQTTNTLQTGGTILSVDAVDTSGAPRWSWNANLTYHLDRWTGNVEMRYYSPIKYSDALIGPEESNYTPASPISINQNVFPAAITYNLHVAYDIIKEDDGHDLQIYLNVDNLLNTPPPLIWSYVSNYDVVGRYFRIGLRYDIP